MSVYTQTEDAGPNDFKEQVIAYGENNNFKITREDPYGMYYVKLEKGMVPQSLSGSYTTRQLAEQEVNAYVTRNKPKVRETVKPVKE